jgi:uncharacterized protein YjcR
MDTNPKRFCDYAAEFGVSESTIRNWRKRKLNIDDPVAVREAIAQRWRKFWAEQYGVSRRTVSRWKARGYDVTNPFELLKAVGRQRHTPDGLKAKLGRLASNDKNP